MSIFSSFTRFLVLAFILSMPLFADLAANSTGLQTSISGDILASFGKDEGPQTGNKLEVREAEVGFFASVDHLFDGVAVFAAHQEEGAAVLEIHELNVGSTRLIARSRFRLGQFFIPMGRLNQIHRHDWPFITAPKVQSAFFDDEGIQDTGAEFTFLFPTPFFLDITVGMTNGWVFGHAHTVGSRPKVPLHYARLSTFFGKTLFAVNYLGRKDFEGKRTALIGIDGTTKIKTDGYLEYLFQWEAWLKSEKFDGEASENTIGAYLFPEYGFDNVWRLGVRLDGFTNLDLKDISGKHVSNFSNAVVPTLTYRSSEFATFRAAYTLSVNRADGQNTSYEHKAELQAIFILGAHPAHEF